MGKIAPQQLIRVLGRLQDALAIDDEQKAYITGPQFEIDSKVFVCICVDLQIDAAPFTGLLQRKEEWLNSPSQKLFNDTKQLFDRVFDTWDSQREYELPEELIRALEGDKPTDDEQKRQRSIRKYYSQMKKEGVMHRHMREQRLMERFPDITEGEIRALHFQDRLHNTSGRHTVENTNEAMMILLDRAKGKGGDDGFESLISWPAEMWATELDVDRSTIVRTDVWSSVIMKFREENKSTRHPG